MSICVKCKAYDKCFASVLSKTELAVFEKEISAKIVKRGEVIFKENNHANTIFVLLEGDVKLEHQSTLVQPVILRIVHCCESIGLETMLSNRKYLMTAVATSNALCCVIPKSDIENIVLKNRTACTMLMEAMQNEQERIYKHSLLMILGTSEAKLAQALLSLSYKDGVVSNSKEEIALMTGLTRETVSRLLSKLKAKRIIESYKREVVILKRDELEKLISCSKESLN